MSGKHFFAALILVFMASVSMAGAQSRLKDLVDIEGVRKNQLVGYGLVVGLNGTGDQSRNSPFTDQSLRGMLERLGVSVRGDELRTRNVAAVTVTASLPAFARQGTGIDVVVSSLGDASSLSGGVLLATPLVGADGEVYAVAQGSIVAGGSTAQGEAQTAVKNVPTVASLPDGAIVEREVGFAMNDMDVVRLALRNPDFTTAGRIVEAVNLRLGMRAATMLDRATVEVSAGDAFNASELMAAIEGVEVVPDTAAKVVVDDRTGTIVIGDSVRIGRVAVSQGGLSVTVSERPVAVQAVPMTPGETVVLPSTKVEMKEVEGGFEIVDGPVLLRDLVDGLNALGVKPRDMISILQAIKASGAMSAEMEVM